MMEYFPPAFYPTMHQNMNHPRKSHVLMEPISLFDYLTKQTQAKFEDI